MIEMRFVEYEYPEFNGGEKGELQYRFVLFTSDASGALCPPDEGNLWSEWKIVPKVQWSSMDT